MPACASIDWNMKLVFLRGGEPKETPLSFVDVEIVFGLISGEVHYNGNRVSLLHGVCLPRKNASNMFFWFDLPGVEILLAGRAVEDEQGNVKFYGVFRAFGPRTGIFAEAVNALPDEGETGTGNGMQAQNPTKLR